MARFSVPGFTVLLLAVALAPLATAQAPEVFGVVNGASFTPFGEPGHPMAPGSIVSIFGTNFADSLLQSMSVPLSTSLGSVSVTFDGIPAPLFFVLPDDPDGQIIAQLPSELVGPTATIEVSTDWGEPNVFHKVNYGRSAGPQIQMMTPKWSHVKGTVRSLAGGTDDWPHQAGLATRV